MAHKSAQVQATVITTKTRSKWLSKWFLLSVFIVICIVIASYLIYKHDQDRNTARANAQQQKSLQQSLSVAVGGINDYQSIISNAGQLISGAAAGRFTLSNSTLAQYHLDRANAYVNLNENSQAVGDYASAAKLDSNLKFAALQGEVEAGYMAGQRKQLIPLYQELIKLEDNIGDPMRSSVVTQYQQNIQALQHNQGLNF